MQSSIVSNKNSNTNKKPNNSHKNGSFDLVSNSNNYGDNDSDDIKFKLSR